MYKIKPINHQITNIIKERIPPKSVILYGILNWGLGHASRSIPIIQELLKQGHTVHIATEGLPLKWLKNELEGVVYHPLKEVKISYPTRFMWFNMFIQLPYFLYQIFSDHKQARQLIKITGANVIISDNRFNFRNSFAQKNIYITHQLNLHHTYQIIEKIISKGHQYFIQKFSECWIPDSENNPLAGKLSERKDLLNLYYIGNVTRVKIKPDAIKNIDILFILSGPEPQRTYLENDICIILTQLSNQTITLVRGSEKPVYAKNIPPNIRIYDIATSAVMEDLINRAKTIVCRSGYSTLMDIAAFQAHVILIPTPGQTEQEYLADYLVSKLYSYQTLSQKEVLKNLNILLNESRNSLRREI